MGKITDLGVRETRVQAPPLPYFNEQTIPSEALFHMCIRGDHNNTYFYHMTTKGLNDTIHLQWPAKYFAPRKQALKTLAN